MRASSARKDYVEQVKRFFPALTFFLWKTLARESLRMIAEGQQKRGLGRS